MQKFSIAIPVKRGVSSALLPASFHDRADGDSLELVFGDGSTGQSPVLGPGVRRVINEGATVFTLRRASIAAAKNEWVIVIEDHCIPDDNILTAFSQAIEANPQADVISGSVTNVRSTSRWSWAYFLFGREKFWPPAATAFPAGPSVANLAIRRSAIDPAELAQDFGFENRTLDRLSQAGRHVHWPQAVVDHVQHGGPLAMMQSFFDNARTSGDRIRQEGSANKAAIRQVLRAPLSYTLVTPIRTGLRVRHTQPFTMLLIPRMMLIGTAAAVGMWIGFLFGPGKSPWRVA